MHTIILILIFLFISKMYFKLKTHMKKKFKMNELKKRNTHQKPQSKGQKLLIQSLTILIIFILFFTFFVWK